MDRKGKIILLHIRGYTVDEEKLRKSREIEIPTLKKAYDELGIEFRELEVWPNGLTTISVFDAVNNARKAIDEVYEENPQALIGLSGHSLGAEVALITAYSMNVDFLILEDAPIGGAYDNVLRFKFDLANQAVITGLRKESPAIKIIKEEILPNNKDWPPTIEIRGWFAIGGQFLFDNFPCTGFGEVVSFITLNHHQVWTHKKVIARIAKFAHSINDRKWDWR